MGDLYIPLNSSVNFFGPIPKGKMRRNPAYPSGQLVQGRIFMEPNRRQKPNQKAIAFPFIKRQL